MELLGALARLLSDLPSPLNHIVVALVCAVLLASPAMGAWHAWRDQRAGRRALELERLQLEVEKLRLEVAALRRRAPEPATEPRPAPQAAAEPRVTRAPDGRQETVPALAGWLVWPALLGSPVVVLVGALLLAVALVAQLDDTVRGNPFMLAFGLIGGVAIHRGWRWFRRARSTRHGRAQTRAAQALAAASETAT